MKWIDFLLGSTNLVAGLGFIFWDRMPLYSREELAFHLTATGLIFLAQFGSAFFEERMEGE